MNENQCKIHYKFFEIQLSIISVNKFGFHELVHLIGLLILTIEKIKCKN